MEEMGCGQPRQSIRRWFRELQLYGFIVRRTRDCLGVEGKGKAPQWRLTEARNPVADAKDTSLPRTTRNGTARLFNGTKLGAVRRTEAEKTESRTRNNVQGGRETTSRPGRETTSTSPSNWTRNNAISAAQPGRETTSISRLTTRGGAGGSSGEEGAGQGAVEHAHLRASARGL